MKILSKPFVALATAWTNLNEFQKARLKLTGQYLLILFLVLNIFTFSVWGILQKAEKNYQNQVSIHYQKQEKIFTEQGVTVIQIQKVAKPVVTKEKILDWQHLFLQNIKYQILWLEIVLLFFAGFCSYWLADKNLLPIKKKMANERQFLSDVSHELKNPLSAIQTTLEVYQKQEKFQKNEIQEIFGDLLQEIKRLTKLTDDLLFLEKNIKKSREILDLTQILQDTQKKLASLASQKGISWQFFAKGKSKIKGHKNDLEKLFFNLLHNAIKFSPPHKKVVIRLQDKVVEIENFGKISRDFQKKAFQRFTKEEISRDFQTGGNGLGLAIVKKIADEHRALISLKTTPNKVIFRLTF